MNEYQFQFSNVVVVGRNLIGVIVKTWGGINSLKEPTYDVYVRSFNCIKEYPQSKIRHFVYDKELSEEDLEYQS